MFFYIFEEQNQKTCKLLIVRINPLLSLLLLYSILLNNNKVANEVSIIGFDMSNDKTLNKPNPAKSIVITDNIIFIIFIANTLLHKLNFQRLSPFSSKVFFNAFSVGKIEPIKGII